MKTTQLLTILVFISIFSKVANAVDPGDNADDEYYTNSVSSNQFSRARKLIDKGEYESAIGALKAITNADEKNANAWNLIGYSYRKMGNLELAGNAYNKALKYDPNHKGALEYQGQLFINLNDIAKAKANRDRLLRLCPEGCEALSRLTVAITSAN